MTRPTRMNGVAVPGKPITAEVVALSGRDTVVLRQGRHLVGYFHSMAEVAARPDIDLSLVTAIVDRRPVERPAAA